MEGNQSAVSRKQSWNIAKKKYLVFLATLARRFLMQLTKCNVSMKETFLGMYACPKIPLM